jgi:predicted nucleotidyltransferase
MLLKLKTSLAGLMSIAADLHEKRPEIVRIATKHQAADVRVFGSVACGIAGPDSDVDLVVRFLPGAILFHHAVMIRELKVVLAEPASDSGRSARKRGRNSSFAGPTRSSWGS